MKTIGKTALRKDLLKYLREAEQGYELVITDHGRPAARIIPPPGKIRIVPPRKPLRKIRKKRNQDFDSPASLLEDRERH